MSGGGNYGNEGAAVGTAIGSIWGPVGAGVGGAIGGMAGAYIKRGGSGMPYVPPPPNPVAPGAINSDYGNVWYDPYTRSWQQGSYGFDPSGMGRTSDADLMYSQFMGMGTGRQTDDINWRIRQLEQAIARERGPGAIGSRKLSVTDYVGKEWVDPATGELWSDDALSNANNIDRNSGLFKKFMADTGGKYGSKNPDISFAKWARDAKRNIQGQLDVFEQDSRADAGNQDVRGRSLEDLENQLAWYQGERERVGRVGDLAAQNPLMRYLQDQGPSWQGGDNTNPLSGEWGALTRSKLEGAGADPWASKDMEGVLSAFDPDGSYRGRSDYLAEIEALAGDPMLTGRIEAPEMDPMAASNLRQSMDYQTTMGMRGQAAMRDATMARRGMGGSAAGEYAAAADRESMHGLLMDNALRSAQYGNDLTAQNFGMRAQALGLNNAGVSADNAAILARRGMRLQATRDAEGQQFGRSMDLANLGQRLRSDWYQQALSATGMGNAMRDQDRGYDLQDYEIGRAENREGYARNMGMFDLLNRQRQQEFQNQMTRSGASLNAAQTLMPHNMAMQGQFTNRNVGAAQMANTAAMANYMGDLQDSAARDAATGRAAASAAKAADAWSAKKASASTASTASTSGTKKTGDR